MTIKFKSPIVVEPNKFTWVDVEFPDPGPNNVIYHIRACLICGSDLHIYKGLHPTVPLPAACGHEIAAEVIQVGSEVTKVKVGDRVYFAGMGAIPFNVGGKTVRRFPSGFGEYTMGDESRAYKIPSNVSYYQAATTTDYVYITNAIRESRGGIGDSAVIIGAGPLGLRTLEIAKLSGISPIIVSEVVDYRLEKAKELGADHAVNPMKEDSIRRVMEITDGVGVDKVYDTTGNPEATSQGLRMLTTRRGGRGTLYMMGLYERPDITFNASDLKSKAGRIIAPMGTAPPLDREKIIESSLSLISQGKLHPMKWITHKIPESRADEAMMMLIEKKNNAIGVQIVH